MLALAAVVVLSLVVALALAVGRVAALGLAVVGFFVLNWFFTAPVHTLRIRSASDVATLVVFVVVAVAVSAFAERLRTEITTLRADSAPDVLEVGDLRIDFAAQRVDRLGEQVALTPTEWKFLELLARHVDALVPREQVLREVWGPVYATETHYLRVYIGQLRRKLEDDPANPRHLITTPGVGYTLRR